METNERLPISNEKISLFRRIYNKLFYKKTEESEISKIAEKLSLEREQDPRENSEAGFVPDKRTVVYDFFEKNIPEAPIRGETLRYGYRRMGSDFEERVEFENASGNKRSFSLTKDERWYEYIECCGKKIRIYGPNGEYDLIQKRHLWGEIISVVRYNNFINQYSEDKTLVNELGRVITEIAKNYTVDTYSERVKVEKRLNQILSKNPIYISARDSFLKAHSEYTKTNTSFRNAEQDRRENFEKKNSFREELKVEDFQQIEQNENVESKEKEEVERED